MPFGQTWSLWQRMPPRYQLTSRYVDEYVDKAVNTDPDRGSTPRVYPTPRPQSASLQKDNILTSYDNDNTDNNLESSRQRISETTSFPRRKSDYISHFQTQQRVSSARRWFAESPPTPATHRPTGQHVPISSTQRAQTAPAFPVTNPGSYQQQNKRLLNKERCRQNATNVFQFDDSKSVKRVEPSVKENDSHRKNYMVQTTNDAVMYIDNGKVIYFRKSRHDLSNLLKTQTLRSHRNNCFIAELRRDYLKHPKYYPRRSGNITDARVLASERVNYNDKLEHILKYYSDNKNESEKSRATDSNKQNFIKGLRPPVPPSRPPSRESPFSPDRLSPTDLIKMHRQSKLHKRKFYLRTPSEQHTYSTKELESCRCCMCRVELQLALVTGLQSDIALAATSPKIPLNPSSYYQKNVLTRDETGGSIQTAQTNMASHELGVKETNRVTFQEPDKTKNHKAEKPKEHTLTISCTLPEMTDIARGDSGPDTDRTNNATSTQ